MMGRVIQDGSVKFVSHFSLGRSQSSFMLLSKQPPYPKADMYVVKADIAALKADMSESEVRLIKWMVSLYHPVNPVHPC